MYRLDPQNSAYVDSIEIGTYELLLQKLLFSPRDSKTPEDKRSVRVLYEFTQLSEALL